MTRRFSAVSDWYVGLTGRERVLVGIAGGLAAVLVLVYAIVLPLGAAHDEAHLRHQQALITAGDVHAGLAALDKAPQRGTGGGAVASLAAAFADAEGLVLQGNTARGNDMTSIAVPTATPGAVFAFLETLRRQGIIAEQVTISPSADGSVAFNATLRRAGS